jgi:hypothetical protein
MLNSNYAHIYDIQNLKFYKIIIHQNDNMYSIEYYIIKYRSADQGGLYLRLIKTDFLQLHDVLYFVANLLGLNIIPKVDFDPRQ